LENLYMKKTLVALAVLAASGASFAQVAITGTVAMGYEADSDKTGATNSGFGVDTSVVNFAASEDLGGGLKASAVLGFDGMNRAAVGGGDTTLALSGSFGTVKLAAARGSDYLSGGSAGVAGIGLDGKLFSTLVATDAVSYKSPAFGAFAFGLIHEEVTTTETNAGGLGIGYGASGLYPAAYQRRNGLNLYYNAGALNADFGYQAYDQQGATPAADPVGKTTPNMVSRTRGSISYDLGAAKVGAGIDARNLTAGTRTDSLVSVAVPLGALTLGAEYGTRRYDSTGQGALEGTRTGYGLKAGYDLSKRTNVGLTYIKWDAVTMNTVNASNVASTYTALLLAHSF
jgi:Gram-negative porin